MTQGKRPHFDLQGHRGARGLRPENTLPSFEAALDACVSTVETDVHLTADGVPVLYHDHNLNDRLCRVAPGSPAPVDLKETPLVAAITLGELRGFRADRNPDPSRFPDQDPRPTPLTEMFATQTGLAPYAIPALADLFAFVRAYAAKLGKQAGKTPQQQKKAARVRFDLELKRTPFMPQAIGDNFSGQGPAHLEKKLVKVVQACNMDQRVLVRSFDHRAVKAVKKLAPAWPASVLLADTAVVAPGQLARQARAEILAPDYRFVDAEVIRQAHAQNIKVIPWTVNDPRDWAILIAWGVDGLTTDYPDRLADWLRKHHVEIL